MDRKFLMAGKRWALLALLLALPATAATVYRTVDDNGVVSFSDTPPDTSSDVQTLEVQAPAASDSEVTQQRLEAMRETTDRMAADRMAREKHRAELRQLEAETAALEQAGDPDAYPDYNDNPTIVSGGYYGGYYDYPRYHHRPRPHHPIAHPPLRPGHPGHRPGHKPGHARPLPGNDYPASLVRRHYMPPVRAVFER